MAKEVISAIFDYSSLDDGAAASIKEATTRIRSAAINSYVEIGKELIRVRGALPHGAWGPWLAAEFGWSDRHARNFMAAAELAEANRKPFSVLSPSVVMALASPSTPEPARAAILERASLGTNITVTEAKSVIRQEKGKLKEEADRQAKAARRARMSPEEIRREDRSKAARDRSKAARERRERQYAEESRKSHDAWALRKANAKRLAEMMTPLIAGRADVIALVRGDVDALDFLSLLRAAVVTTGEGGAPCR